MEAEGFVISLDDALKAHAAAGGAYHQFFQVPEMSAGIYTLPAGGVDGQAPHVEDEIYYVVSGKAQVQIGDDSHRRLRRYRTTQGRASCTTILEWSLR